MKPVLAILAALVTAVPQPAVTTPWPDEAYRVEWEEAHIPKEVAPSVRIAVPVTLRNTGDRAWPASQVFVAYHWMRDERLAVWDGERTPLPRDLRAGSRAAVSAGVATPSQPGSYVLVLTLVHEHVTWFEHRGASTITRTIKVGQPTQPVACGIDGSTPCEAIQ